MRRRPAFAATTPWRGLQVDGGRGAGVCSRYAVRMGAGVYVGKGMKAEDVVTVGVATCFQRVGGKLEEVLILEPLPASAVDCIARLQVPTSYRRLYGTTLGELSEDVNALPDGVIVEGESVALGEAFEERVQAAARTFRRSPEIAELIPPGTLTEKLNYSVATKRILNEDWQPNFEDNVKQDISIDVYNRADDVDSSEVMAGYNA